LISLDVFRGMTIAGMILVNNAGNWNAVWWPLDHSAWHGWTPTDLIFPFFLFIVGVSMVLSFEARRKATLNPTLADSARVGHPMNPATVGQPMNPAKVGHPGATRGELLRHTIRRSAIIFAIGFALAFWSKSFNPHTVRIYGVLERIAVVYLVASAMVLYCGRKTRAIIAAALLAGYWLLMTRVPGFDLTMDGNLAGFVDRKLLYEHLWIAHRFDPEGILSTIPAVVTTLIGVFTGQWLRKASGDRLQASGKAELGSGQKTPHLIPPNPGGIRVGHPPGHARTDMTRKVQGMVIAGAVMMLAGEVWGRWFPINKNLWTSSYVLFTGGFALALLALCYWMIEVRGWKRWGAPFVWYGSNAITVYALSSALGVFSVKYHVQPGMTYKAWVYGKWFAPFAKPLIASAMYASAYVLAFLVLAWVMYRKKIFVKI
jgi:predicted acyltransferase